MCNEGRLPWTSFERFPKAPQHDWLKLFVRANEMMLKSFDDHQGDVPRNEKSKRPKDQEPKRQERSKKRKVTGEESRCRKMVKNRFGVA